MTPPGDMADHIARTHQGEEHRRQEVKFTLRGDTHTAVKEKQDDRYWSVYDADGERICQPRVPTFLADPNGVREFVMQATVIYYSGLERGKSWGRAELQSELRRLLGVT